MRFLLSACKCGCTIAAASALAAFVLSCWWSWEWPSGSNGMAVCRGGIQITLTRPAEPRDPSFADDVGLSYWVSSRMFFMYPETWNWTDFGCEFRGYPRSLVLTAPLWSVFVVTAPPALFLWRRDWKTARHKRLGLCPSCGYDRRGLADDAACPECGSAKCH